VKPGRRTKNLQLFNIDLQNVIHGVNMTRNTLKYIGLGLIAVALLAVNVNMVYRTFFAKNRLNPDLKKSV